MQPAMAALRFVKPGDSVSVIHIENTDKEMVSSSANNQLVGTKAVCSYYRSECAKAQSRLVGVSFLFTLLQLSSKSIATTILEVRPFHALSCPSMPAPSLPATRLPKASAFTVRAPFLSPLLHPLCLQHTEAEMTDLIIMGSVELSKPGADSNAIGSVCAAIARKTQAHILIAKHFV